MNYSELRKSILTYFSDDEIAAFCFDYFPYVYEDFTIGMSKSRKVQLLLEYVRRRDGTNELISALQRERPNLSKLESFSDEASIEKSPPEFRPQIRNPRQVFISYQYEDQDFVHRLANDLSAKGYEVWISPDSIKPGEKWVDAINRGLETSGVYIAVLTPQAVTSRWFKSETNAAMELEHAKKIDLILILLRPCEIPPLWNTYGQIPFNEMYDEGLKTLFDQLDRLGILSNPVSPAQIETRPINEAKLILVGQGGVGKTSLVRRLLGETFDSHEMKTEGIAIDKWPINILKETSPIMTGETSNKNGGIVTLNIWDFGGQEIMHATHQFFLTQRSLYLLVLDARQGEQESRVEYWLSLIRSFAADSPILVIINKDDQNYLDLNRRGLQQKYPSISGFVRTSAKTGDGIDALKNAICNALLKMEHLHTPFPQSWWEIKESLEALHGKTNYITFSEFQDLCIKRTVDNDQNQRRLLRYLHDLGIVINFHDDPRIRDTNILSPEWVTQGIYSILNSSLLAKANGVLYHNQLSSILNNDSYPPEKHGFILLMMEKFELSYPFESRDRHLVPDLLPVEEPIFDWDNTNELKFEFHYQVLPHSILHRFIVRQYAILHPEIYWRTGSLLVHHGMQALVKADIEDRKVSIAINGKGRRREFLAMLRFTFNSINQSIRGIKPEQHVPIPGQTGITVPYEFLLELEQDGEERFRFPGIEGALGVRQLLDGIETIEYREQVNIASKDLYLHMHQQFNLPEIREICFELTVVFEDLLGSTRTEKAMSLIEYLERRGRLPELIKLIRKKRPNLSI